MRKGTVKKQLFDLPQIIELKRDPGGNAKQKMGKTTMKATGVANYNNKPVQSISDMLRIAKKVNAKLRNSLVEIEKEIQHANCLFDSSSENPSSFFPNA